MEKTNIYELLNQKQEIDRILIESYKDKIERVFQIYYECDSPVTLIKLSRVTPKSNFAVVFASAFLKSGDTIKTSNEYRKIEYDVNIVIEFFVPLYLLDTGTPYQICEIVDNLIKIKSTCDDDFFKHKIEDESFLADDPYETINEFLESNDSYNNDFEKYGDKVSGFDLNDLNKTQKESLKFSLMTMTNFYRKM